MQDVQQLGLCAIENVERVIVGKSHAVRLTMVALLCNGHVLIEDVPGVGKTVLAKSFARSIGARFRRIQFTPDLLPSDITGVEIYNQQSRTFEFRPGPLLAHIVLADEINRATPKTQSALLESMEERQITIDGQAHPLPSPFVVLATQNPVDFEGTFPLPEAQLDRFLLTITLGYPRLEEEVAMLGSQQRVHPLESLTTVIDVEALLAAQAQVREVYVDEAIRRYIVTMVQETRQHPDVRLGASPRGSIALYHAAQAWAALAGRAFVLPDDVKAVAMAALSHRLIGRGWMEPGDRSGAQIVAEILDRTAVPGAGGARGVAQHAGRR
ncbi:MAG TPA: MoxR family ATPase [Chloroflexota bacterium]|nr:MoxR family ATPase [Chloroflexota bacterium]